LLTAVIDQQKKAVKATVKIFMIVEDLLKQSNTGSRYVSLLCVYCDSLSV